MADFDARRFNADEEIRREDEWYAAGGSEGWYVRLEDEQARVDSEAERADVAA